MDKTSFKDNIKKYYNHEAELRESKSVKSEWKIKVRQNFYNVLKQEGI